MTTSDPSQRHRDQAIAHLERGTATIHRWFDGWQTYVSEWTRVSKNVLTGQYEDPKAVFQDVVGLTACFWDASLGWLVKDTGDDPGAGPSSPSEPAKDGSTDDD